jgi:hypothetical protein
MNQRKTTDMRSIEDMISGWQCMLMGDQLILISPFYGEQAPHGVVSAIRAFGYDNKDNVSSCVHTDRDRVYDDNGKLKRERSMQYIEVTVDFPVKLTKPLSNVTIDERFGV